MKKSIPELHTVIGHNLKTMRQNACLSQSKLGQVLGVSFQQIQKYEKGINRLPAEHMYKLKNYLNVPYEHFFQSIEGHKYNQKMHRQNRKLTEEFIRKLEKINDMSLKTKALRITILID